MRLVLLISLPVSGMYIIIIIYVLIMYYYDDIIIYFMWVHQTANPEFTSTSP